jgi:hypothetical protein
MSTFPVISDNPVIQNHYLECRSQGTSHALAEMFALAQSPHGISDCTFMRDTANGKQFEGNEQLGNAYKKAVEANGGTWRGKYLSGVARFFGDPEACVDGRGDVQRVLEKRGWGCEGTINVKARETGIEPAPPKDMADDLVTKYATEIALRDPNPHLVDMVDLKEQVKEKMAPKRKKK